MNKILLKTISIILIISFGLFILPKVLQAIELVRQKNIPTIIVFPIVDANCNAVTSIGTTDTELDGFADGTAPDGFADCTEPTEIGTSGFYYIALTTAEMNSDYIVLRVLASTTEVPSPAQSVLIRTMTGDPANNEVSALSADSITAAVIASNAIGDAELAADVDTLVNDEIVDALATDTYAEPGQGAPAATASLKDKINYIYKYWRNKIITSANTIEVYNDAGNTVDQKSAISDSGTAFTRGEMATGP